MGHIMRYKERLIAKDYSQVNGVQFNETSFLFENFTTRRTITAIGTTIDLEIHQMDAKTTFLNGELEVDIYIE